MRNDYLKNLHAHMFDGEGGDGGAGAGAPGGAAESSAEPTVVYGKAEAGEEASQVGTDKNGEGAEENADPQAEFMNLINGQYRDQYDAHVQNIMRQRFRNTENYQETISSYDKAVAPLYTIYGIQPGDIQGLERAIANDDGLYTARAEEAGITPQQYKENMRLRMEAQQGRTMVEEMRRQQEKQRTFDRWDREAEALTETFPAFNLRMELENQEFQNLLDRGYSVRDAFMSVHLGDILNGMAGEVKTNTTKSMIDNMRTRQARPAENAATTQPAVIRKTDPSKWTDEDFDKVENMIQNGEKIIL